MPEEKTALDLMAEDLKAIREALARLEKSGLNLEIMIMYISKKSGMSQTNVRAVLDSQKSFLEEAFKTQKK